MTTLGLIAILTALSAAAVWSALAVASNSDDDIEELHRQAEQRRRQHDALARATGHPIDVGRQRTTEPRHALMGGPGQCISCFSDTAGSDSDNWCVDCHNRLRSRP